MTSDTITFDQLALNKSLLKALDEVGYESPSPIQAQTIPLLLEGRDIIGQAQTGTGKTAAFALPLISNLELKQKDPQVLVLAPTRELAIQVAEAFQKYAKHMKGFHVLPVYGGQDYRLQTRALQRGVHVVVGTPGRVMDHMRRGTMKLDNLKTLVLDEADEMLRMGFIDDVEWVLEQLPEQRQIALFSATMPSQIRRIATKYLTNPEQVTIKEKTATASTIRQRFWPVSGLHKLDALTRILEAEPFDAVILFVRTKIATVELADKLQARGYSAAALNGDIQQKQREKTINDLKKEKIDILVATDVAARGLDVQRISHVINYDIPYDTEAYIHRIGRTGRAGREGDAILFVAPREKRLLHSIEKATKKKIEMMELPSTELINDNRIAKFQQRITDTIATEELGLFHQMMEQYQLEHNTPAIEIAAALAHLLQGDVPFLLQNKPHRSSKENWEQDTRPSRRGDRGDRSRGDRNRGDRGRDHDRGDRKRTARPEMATEEGMVRYRIEVGHSHEVRPGNIVGAIANEGGIDSKNMGQISIYGDYSLVDLPKGLSKDTVSDLKKVWVAGQQLKISEFSKEGNASRANERVVKRKAPPKPTSERVVKRKSPPKAASTDKKAKGKKKDKPRHTTAEKKKAKEKRESKAKKDGTFVKPKKPKIRTNR
ncbi:MAG: DEAD/DEAH box helicase [Sulfuriflexus sp.]|nr:DEAD/DEAH box helicase [Sulfuriflexus sp.]